MINVHALPVGAKAIVLGVKTDANGDATRLNPASQRLLELGFTPGATVELMHRSPLGDVLAIMVDGTYVLLGLTEAMLLSLAGESQ